MNVKAQGENMKKSILIEGTFHKEHFKIFDQDCLALISDCSELIRSNRSSGPNKTSNRYTPLWSGTVEYYNMILKKEVHTPRKINRIEQNILIDNIAVDGYLVDFLIYYYHTIKNNLIIAKDLIISVIYGERLSKEEEGLIMVLFSHFNLCFDPATL